MNTQKNRENENLCFGIERIKTHREKHIRRLQCLCTKRWRIVLKQKKKRIPLHKSSIQTYEYAL